MAGQCLSGEFGILLYHISTRCPDDRRADRTDAVIDGTGHDYRTDYRYPVRHPECGQAVFQVGLSGICVVPYRNLCSAFFPRFGHDLYLRLAVKNIANRRNVHPGRRGRLSGCAQAPYLTGHGARDRDGRKKNALRQIQRA
ncbi:hypothetical protein D3C71_1668080 [compost metagenome]